MGFIINEAITLPSGLTLTGAYCSVNGNGHITKHKHYLFDPLGNNSGELIHYRVFASAQLWISKESYQQRKEPLIRSIPVESGELTLEEVEQTGGVMKNIIYPALKQKLGFTDYTDD